MRVEKSCSDDDLAVVVKTSEGEHLVYRITAGVDDVEYSLVTEAGKVLADKGSCPSPCRRKWPDGPDEPGSDNDQQHTLSLVFVSEGSVDYEVTKHDAEGGLLDTVKQCRYTLTGARDNHFAGLRVVTT